jgi:hypothetical protein
MPQYTGLEDLPPTLFEQAAERDRIITESNERRERIRLRRANKQAGYKEPAPGDTLHVQLDNTVTKRTRGGIRFERGHRRTIKVVEETGDALLELQRSGHDVTDVYGAERILEDAALHVYSTATVDRDADELAARNAQLEEELRLERAEHESLKKRLREARQAAPASSDGAPTRLQAAAKVRDEAGVPQFGATTEPMGDNPQQGPAPRAPANPAAGRAPGADPKAGK